MSTDRQMQMVGSPEFADDPTNMLAKGVAPIAQDWARYERAPGKARDHEHEEEPPARGRHESAWYHPRR